jgi:hypothetical protein
MSTLSFDNETGTETAIGGEIERPTADSSAGLKTRKADTARNRSAVRANAELKR